MPLDPVARTIIDAIEQVFPMFQGFNTRIRVPGGFHLTSLARVRIWATASGKAQFSVFEGLARASFFEKEHVIENAT